MDRRTFLTGVLGLAGAAVVTTVVRPVDAVAGVPNTGGILNDLEASATDVADDGGEAKVELVDHRRRHHRRHDRHHHHRRRHRKRVWRRVCRRYRRHGRWHTRCYRERAWVWYYR
ncbi:twin-arginine translocation signal domain-containing protein [Mesorhizobium koreense]|uniref:twin-arginine translocation signal domain-containing protein n=1 Tax=Mesorhizobium koreense TaxID=3074855 RepID=UPI00287B8514|nr:twin-arginine translocation signal domain-containing protein [Mesorhizobium sp. WR6]